MAGKLQGIGVWRKKHELGRRGEEKKRRREEEKRRRGEEKRSPPFLQKAQKG
jgi:hypothetical protein